MKCLILFPGKNKKNDEDKGLHDEVHTIVTGKRST